MPDDTEFEELHKRIRCYLGFIQERLEIPADNTDVSGYDLFKSKTLGTELTPDAVTAAEINSRHLEATQRFRGGFDRMYGEASREIRSALEQAKAILLDTSKRAAYDRWLEERRRTTEPSRPSPLEQIELMLDVLIRDDSITASEKTRLLTKAEELGISVRDVEALLRRRGVRTISDAERAEAERRRWEREEAERRTREEAERRRRTEQVLLHWFSLCEGCISLTLYPFTPFGLAFYEGGAAGARPPAPFRREGAIENFYNVMVDKPVKGL